MKRFVQICSFCCLTSTLFADLQNQSSPWTPSYLTATSNFAIDRFSARTKHTTKTTPRYQGRYSMTMAPFIDWGMDVSLMASSIKTPKLSLRAERQILCDLTGDAVSLTGVCNGSIAALDRAKKPIFFEMSAKTLEVGIGVGRHIVNEKSYYTQLFSYLKSGVGSKGARFSSAEIGINHVYDARHHIMASMEYLRTYPRDHRQFAGIATQKTSVVSFGIWYKYRFDSGVEASGGYIKRNVHSKFLSAAATIQVQLSLPLAF